MQRLHTFYEESTLGHMTAAEQSYRNVQICHIVTDRSVYSGGGPFSPGRPVGCVSPRLPMPIIAASFVG